MGPTASAGAVHLPFFPFRGLNPEDSPPRSARAVRRWASLGGVFLRGSVVQFRTTGRHRSPAKKKSSPRSHGASDENRLVGLCGVGWLGCHPFSPIQGFEPDGSSMSVSTPYVVRRPKQVSSSVAPTLGAHVRPPGRHRSPAKKRGPVLHAIGGGEQSRELLESFSITHCGE